jgi:hypothetical protein
MINVLGVYSTASFVYFVEVNLGTLVRHFNPQIIQRRVLINTVMNIDFHKCPGNSWKVERLLASQEGLYSMQFVFIVRCEVFDGDEDSSRRLWSVSPCCDVVGYQRFGVKSCPHLHPDDMGGTCSTHGEDEKSVQNFNRKISRAETTSVTHT